MLITFAELQELEDLTEKKILIGKEISDTMFELEEAKEDLAEFKKNNPYARVRDPELVELKSDVAGFESKLAKKKAELKEVLTEIKRVTLISQVKNIKKPEDKIGGTDRKTKKLTLKNATDDQLDKATGWDKLKSSDKVKQEITDELDKIVSHFEGELAEDNNVKALAKDDEAKKNKANEKKIEGATYYVIIDEDGNYVDVDGELTASVKKALVFTNEDTATRHMKFYKELSDDLEVQRLPSTINKKIPQENILDEDDADSLKLTNSKAAKKKSDADKKKKEILSGSLYAVMANGNKFVSVEGGLTKSVKEAQIYTDKDVAEEIAESYSSKYEDATVFPVTGNKLKTQIPFENIDTSESTGVTNPKTEKLRREKEKELRREKEKELRREKEKELKEEASKANKEFLANKYFGIYVWTDDESGWLSDEDSLTENYGNMTFFKGPNAAKAFIRNYKGNFEGLKMSVQSIPQSANEELTPEYLKKINEKSVAPKLDRPRREKDWGEDTEVAGRGFKDDISEDDKRSYRRKTSGKSVDGYDYCNDIADLFRD